MTPIEAADRIPMSRRHVQILVERGKIPTTPHPETGKPDISELDFAEFAAKIAEGKRELAEMFASYDKMREAAIDELMKEKS